MKQKKEKAKPVSLNGMEKDFKKIAKAGKPVKIKPKSNGNG